jgi:ubiquinone/menaquinone biosynthesis C-methylase UbiE
MNAVARVYDVLIAPLERRALSRWRECTWAEVPEHGLGLEIGAGIGANFSYYPKGADIVAIDVSLPMLRRAQGKTRLARTPLVACDAQALPFADATFDWMAETLVFCEVPDPVAGLREIRRVLKPDGVLVMLEHVRPAGWLGRVADAATALSAPVFGEHFNRNVEASVRQAGFDVRRKQWLWRDAVVLLVAYGRKAVA